MLAKLVIDYLIREMGKEDIEPAEFDEDLLLTPDVRDIMEMEVQGDVVAFIDTYVKINKDSHILSAAKIST